MAAGAPASTLAAPPAYAPRLLPCAVAVCVGLTGMAHMGGQVWLGELAALAVTGLFLLPGLRRRRTAAWCAWLGAAALLVLLGLRGHGRLALDGMPVAINLAVCGVFARTLRHGREPLIARVIEALEGRDRLAQPRVASYARRLTWAWTLLLAMQAGLLAVLVAYALPADALAAAGATSGSAGRWYLHLGSYALVPAFLVLEYAFRRCYLRHIPHPSLGRFLLSLVQRWPALAYSVADDTPRIVR